VRTFPRLTLLFVGLSLLTSGMPATAHHVTAPVAGYTDAVGSVHWPAINALSANGITSGCAVDRYCPQRPVTRAQLASLLVRALDLPAAGDRFDDLDGSVHEDAVNALAGAGIAGGCGPRRFCPDDPVKRGQAASLLVAAFELSATATPRFDDITASVHRDAIKTLAGAGVTTGCTSARFCPDAAVTRSAMATLLARSLELPLPPSMLLGVSTPSGPYDITELDAFEQAAGRQVDLMLVFQDLAHVRFDRSLLEPLLERDTLPMIGLEPWDHTGTPDQPVYALRRIAAGDHDAVLREWAEGLRDLGTRVLLRPMHEMNGTWYPWAEAANGNRPGDYVAAWRHLHDLFDNAGATNVEWVWAPNTVFPSSTPLAGLYPGDTYVDWVGIDGYNGGTALDWGGWVDVADLFGPTLDEIRRVAPGKPILIAETGSAEAGGDKAAWIADLFAFMGRQPDVRGIVWFDHDKETDWRITSSPEARRSFATMAATVN
jgi:mannan endo-1,4-beta-mannosidase